MEKRILIGLLALVAVGCSSPEQAATNKAYDEAMAKADALLAAQKEGGSTPRPRLAVTEDAPQHPSAKESRTTTATRAAPRGSIVGMWQGKIEMPKKSGEKDFGAAMAEGMAGMFGAMMTLEFTDEKTFRLSMMGIPCEGPYRREGRKLTLMPETVMGLGVEEYKRQNPEAKMEPVFGEISADGESISLQNDGPAETEGKMVFVRGEAPTPVQRADRLTDPAERSLLGTFAADVEASDLGPKARANAQEAAAAKALLKSVKLELRQDKTFRLNMMIGLEGTWSLRGNQLRLVTTGIAGMPEGGTVSTDDKPMDFVVSADKNMLMVQSPNPKEPGQLVLRRTQ